MAFRILSFFASYSADLPPAVPEIVEAKSEPLRGGREQNGEGGEGVDEQEAVHDCTRLSMVDFLGYL